MRSIAKYCGGQNMMNFLKAQRFIPEQGIPKIILKSVSRLDIINSTKTWIKVNERRISEK